ncbi:MAG: alpha/beta fold hydrolase [Candidatus Symbiobacter sp.]|nr:alpha/beta fold hydrolase [Candidatus Symbiobacter sp.]
MDHTPIATNPEIAQNIVAAGIRTNYHDLGPEPKAAGQDTGTLLMIHGSGPGVSAYANWRLNLPILAQKMRVIAPDMVGFGYSDRPDGIQYSLDVWVRQAVGLLDALNIKQTDVLGNSFGGALALALASRHPERVRRLILMGAVGVEFPLTSGLDLAWGYQPSLENMKQLLDVFAYDRGLVTDDLARLRYQASIRPGVQESFAAMFPAPRQRWITAMCTPEHAIRALPHKTLIIHGRDDRVIPLANALKLLELIHDSRLHVFARCGHWTQIEHAAEFSALVGNFLTN